MANIDEHAAAVANARAHLAAKAGPPLGPLSDGFAASRLVLHTIAERLMKPKRELETGNEIALEFAPDGFGSPPWDDGAVSGSGGQILVEGSDLVSREGTQDHRLPIDVDRADALALADWFAFGTVVLGELLQRHQEFDPAPIRLWPEHFDVATELGSESDGSRANYGASPGDDDHPEPYLYVGPWNQQVEGELWNAPEFVGAELPYAELRSADDQIAAGLRFMTTRVDALG